MHTYGDNKQAVLAVEYSIGRLTSLIHLKRSLQRDIGIHILHSHQENAEILKGSSVEIKYEDYDLYLRHYMYYH